MRAGGAWLGVSAGLIGGLTWLIPVVSVIGWIAEDLKGKGGVEAEVTRPDVE